MKKVTVSVMSGVLALSLAGCSFAGNYTGLDQVSDEQQAQDTYPLSITALPDSAGAKWGTLCQEVLGSGWYCVVETKVENRTQEPWTGTLKAQLVSDSGAVSASSNSPDVSILAGRFSTTVNPGKAWEWAIYFDVGPNQKFTQVNVLDVTGTVVATVPVCLGTTDSLGLGC